MLNSDFENHKTFNRRQALLLPASSGRCGSVIAEDGSLLGVVFEEGGDGGKTLPTRNEKASFRH